MKVSIGGISYGCGLKYVGGFYTGHMKFTNKAVCNYGTGFFVAGFIDNEICKKAYDYFCKTTKLVYQSPVRLNKNSGNQFFFCIFDAK